MLVRHFQQHTMRRHKPGCNLISRCSSHQYFTSACSAFTLACTRSCASFCCSFFYFFLTFPLRFLFTASLPLRGADRLVTWRLLAMEEQSHRALNPTYVICILYPCTLQHKSIFFLSHCLLEWNNCAWRTGPNIIIEPFALWSWHNSWVMIWVKSYSFSSVCGAKSAWEKKIS